jgi:selenocysteine-specific elongation factor
MMSEVEHVIVGTAGHIDHGKTLLVKVLTGIDADTLAEEKRRGITIELGFVFMEAPGYDKQIVFIDVPGHERLVKTMVAGASNIDAALLVVAADEGVSVQTREHFEILQLLGIRKGIVALTKSDLVNEERIHALTEEVRDFVKGSFLEYAPILPVSAIDGSGVEALRKALMDLGDKLGKRHDSRIFRMPIDRVFTMKGFGTVIAGTVLSGEVKEGDRIEIFPDGIEAKVRGIQVHHRKVGRSVIGRRTALNLQDVKKETLRRGQCAGEPGSLRPTHRLDTRLLLLKSYGKPMKNRTRVRLHVGTAEIISRLVLLENDVILPGHESLVQFALEVPTVALPGDRFVIRTFSPLMTIGGGEILDASPEKHKRFDSRTVEGLQKLERGITEAVEQVVLSSGTRPVGLAQLRGKIGEREDLIERALRDLTNTGGIVKIWGTKEPKYLHQESYRELEKTLKSTVQTYLERNPHRMFMPYEELRSKLLERTDGQTFTTVLDGLVEKEVLIRKDSKVSLVGHEAELKPRDQESVEQILREFQKGGFASPSEEDLRQKLGLSPREFKNLIHSQIQKGVLVRLSDKVVYHRDFVEKARRVVLQYLEKYPSITVAELRDLLKLSRKYATAILEYFDRIGLTKRDKDVHILR